MYAGVPITRPVRVWCELMPSLPVSFAMPKSSSLTKSRSRPRWIRMMLSGLRSRWTMPLLVRRGERVGDLQRDRQRALGRQRRLGADDAGDSVMPGEVLHDEVHEPVAAGRAGLDHAVVDDVDDVRMADRR